ncbi:MAG: hypothetical protein BGN88_01535 [Clostridiales bacterium 43-6]|nr:MAG: hypothetical protein BGN88_01535 [Clostridiales bacterium 43-6]
MKNRKSCCFTGEAELPEGNEIEIATKLEATIMKLIKIGVTDFKTSDETGFAKLAASIITKLKTEYHQINLQIIPLRNQAEHGDSKNYEQRIFEPCHELIDTSRFCIVYIKKYWGFPFYNTMYAIGNRNVEIIYI